MSEMRCAALRKSARADCSLKPVSDSPRNTSNSWNVAVKLSGESSFSVPMTR